MSWVYLLVPFFFFCILYLSTIPGLSKIHDPRMRRGSNRKASANQLERESEGLVAAGKSLLGPPPVQMRDPRRKPQTSQTSQKSVW